MGESAYAHQQEFVNTLGHAAGVLVFGIFLALLLRHRAADSVRRNLLALVTVTVALSWNLVSIVVLGLGAAESTPKILFATLGFSLLSILPAMLLHICFGARLRVFVFAGYVLSFVATGFHLAELVSGNVALHRIGLGIITVGFSILTLLTAIASLRSVGEGRRATISRAITAMGLILFSASFAHFAGGHADDAWAAELAVHHAGIPLAMFVILQNQRFLLLDAFIRFLASVLWAGAFTFLFANAAQSLTRQAGEGTSFRLALALVAGCLLLVLYAITRGALERWLSRLLFAGPDVERASQDLRRVASEARGEEEFLVQAATALAGYLGCDLIEFVKARPGLLVLPSVASDLPREFERPGVELTVPLRLGPEDTRYVLLGPRKGGRPFLSEDLASLTTLAAQISTHVEQLRESEMRNLVTQAELRALQAQIHPHFLFNALNTLYGVIPREAGAARSLVLNLSDVLRYFFRSERSYTTLEEEIRVIEAYLEIEKLRLGSKLRVELDIDPEALRQQIPVLSLEPLVENAVKHGIATQAGGGRLRVCARLQENDLAVSVENTGAPFSDSARANRERQGAVGLSNVSRRLALCYGPGNKLSVESEGGITRVAFRVPLGQFAGVSSK